MKKISLLLCACAVSLSVTAFAADTTPPTTGVLPKESCTGTPMRYDLPNYALPSADGYSVNKRIAVNDMIFQEEIRPIVINHQTLVPARAVADALGFTTTWDNSGAVPTITIASKAMKTTLTLGVDQSFAVSTVAIGMTAPISYGAPAVLVGNTAYVPVEVFKVIQGNNPDAIVLTDTGVSIRNV